MSKVSISSAQRLKEKVSLLPNEPGVYRFIGAAGVVMYVGKAKNLRKRVASYFSSTASDRVQIDVMMRQVEDIEHTVLFSEADALLLENNMIKSLKPRYNILLKDDKTFPWIVVRNEPYPRVLSTRLIVKDGSHYYGPYASVGMQKMLLDLVHKLYGVRTCHLKLTEQSVAQGKFSVCLQYHIGNCKAPCVGKQSRQDYSDNISMVSAILKGDIKEAENFLRAKMQAASKLLNFEEASKIKDHLLWLSTHESKSIVVSPQYSDMDIFFPVIEEKVGYCNYMHVQRGAIIYSYTIEMKLGIDTNPAEVLSFAIAQIMDRLNRKLSAEVIVPLEINDKYDGVIFNVPQRGDKVKLLSLSEKNCRLFRLEKLKQLESVNPEKHADRIMENMKRDLCLVREPRHIECFDNSNIQGQYPVAACVVFRDGKPSKREYRHFNIKHVVGIDDFASMEEVLYRRYSRLLEEKAVLPDLIVVDGGKGQLSSAYKVLCQLGLEEKIAIVGLAKRMEEVYYPKESLPLILSKSGATLKVLMHIRDEAHRFGITFHRNKRSAGAIKSDLGNIPTLGDRSIEKLLTHFKSVKKIKESSLGELAKVVGASRAAEIIKYYN